MPSILRSIELKQVINASGRMTALGVSTPAPGSVERGDGRNESVFPDEDLVNKTGEVHCEIAAGGGRGDDGSLLLPVRALPSRLPRYWFRTATGCWKKPALHRLKITKSSPRGTALTARRWERWWRWAAANWWKRFYANECSAAQLAAAITPRTAAILYIKSHHCVRKVCSAWAGCGVESARIISRLFIWTRRRKEDFAVLLPRGRRISLSI